MDVFSTLGEVLKPTQLREVVVYYRNGGKDDRPFCMGVNMAPNVTDEEIKAYYAPGKVFNVGAGPYDVMATVDSVEIIK